VDQETDSGYHQESSRRSADTTGTPSRAANFASVCDCVVKVQPGSQVNWNDLITSRSGLGGQLEHGEEGKDKGHQHRPGTAG